MSDASQLLDYLSRTDEFFSLKTRLTKGISLAYPFDNDGGRRYNISESRWADTWNDIFIVAAEVLGEIE